MTTTISSSTLTRRSASQQAGEVVVTQQCSTKNNVSNIYKMQSRRLRLRRSTAGTTSTILDKPNEIMVPQSTILTFERMPLRFWQRSSTSNDGIYMKRRQKRVSNTTIFKCSRSHTSVSMGALVPPIRKISLYYYIFVSVVTMIMIVSRQQEDYTAYFCGGRAIAFTTTTSSKWNHRILNVGNRNKQLKNGYEAKKGVGEYFVPVDFRKSQSQQQDQPLDNNTIEHLNAAWREASINLKKENKQQLPVSVGDFDDETPIISASSSTHHGNNNNNNEFVEDDPNKYPPTVELERRTTMTEGRGGGMSNEKNSSGGVDGNNDDENGGGFWRSMLGSGNIKMPKKNRAGIYQIETEEQHGAFLEANEGKSLVVMKFYAPYCRACKALEPKFKAIVSHKRYRNLPIKFAEMGARGSTTQQFFQRLGILALPTMLFYDSNNRLVDNFPCAPSKINVFQKKLTQFLTDHVDPETLKLKSQTVSVSDTGEQQITGGTNVDDMMSTTSGMIGYDGQERQPSPSLWEADGPRVTRDILVGNEYVTEEHLNYLKNELSFFKDLTDQEFFDMLSKAKLQTYDAGDIIIRQGMPGTTFYVIKSGTAEMYVRSKFDSLLSTSTSNYLGAVVNELGKFDYFGERALTSGQPLAASVRALDKVRCFAFDVNDIPESSILSKERRATADLVDQLSRRYELPDEYEDDAAAAALASSRPEHDMVLDLLVRFKQIRQATKGFEYILTTNPEFGNKSEAIRRRMLVAKLSQLQRDEFRAVFDMADTNRRGRISLLELKQFMSSAGKEQHYDDDELLEIISRANPAVDGSREYITLDDFMGVMAEAEFYYLFKDTFRELDRDNTGYVKVGDLDEMLGGVSELISDDRGKSLIDNEDKDILVDYEQFSIMLLGAGLY